MTTPALSISDMKNEQNFRRRLNTLLSAYAPGYGSALPSAENSPDGRLFYVGSQGYQQRGGTWVAL